MVTAQRISEDVKAAAKKEAEILVAGAEQQAEKIVQNAHQKLVQVVEDINELKRQRLQFESQVRSVRYRHMKLIGTFSSSNEMERVDERDGGFTPRKTSASEAVALPSWLRTMRVNRDDSVFVAAG